MMALPLELLVHGWKLAYPITPDVDKLSQQSSCTGLLKLSYVPLTSGKPTTIQEQGQSICCLSKTDLENNQVISYKTRDVLHCKMLSIHTHSVILLQLETYLFEAPEANLMLGPGTFLPCNYSMYHVPPPVLYKPSLGCSNHVTVQSIQHNRTQQRQAHPA